MPSRIEATNEFGRARTDDSEERFDRLNHARHATKRESSGAERHHLAVCGVREAPNEMHGIGRGLDVIERAIHLVEPLAER